MKDIIVGLILGVIFTGVVTYFGQSTNATSPCPCGHVISDTSNCGTSR